MANYLISVTEMYKVTGVDIEEAEANAETLINNAKDNPDYILKKYNCEQKSRKFKEDGETYVEDYYRITLTKVFTDEKEPTVSYIPSYTKETGEV